MELTTLLKTRVISRRDFIKMVTSAAAALGLAGVLPKDWAQAAAKPAVIWLHGQECTGCTESIIAGISSSRFDQPDPGEVILNFVEIKYHETIMAAAGDVAEKALEDSIAAGSYILVVEGSIPSSDPRFLHVAGKPLEDTFVAAAKNAIAVIAIGACASYGGINKPCASGGQGMEYFLKKHNINKPLVNLPGCPLKPEWFFGTVVYYLAYGKLPALDQHKRPKMYFSRTVHDDCPRRMYYHHGLFLLDWNDPKQANYCLLLKGCKGQATYANCPTLLWNDGANWCIGSNAPCAGCTEPNFYGGFSPLYQNTLGYHTSNK